MSKEKLFTVVGTAINADGIIKVRWANDLVSRIKILDKAGCTNINLVELPKAMTKIDAAKHFLAHQQKLTAAQKEVLELKIAEKTKVTKRAAVKSTLTKNVKTRVKEKKPTDPRVEKFVKQAAGGTKAKAKAKAEPVPETEIVA